jgi:hypothetical protein
MFPTKDVLGLVELLKHLYRISYYILANKVRTSLVTIAQTRRERCYLYSFTLSLTLHIISEFMLLLHPNLYGQVRSPHDKVKPNFEGSLKIP